MSKHKKYEKFLLGSDKYLWWNIVHIVLASIAIISVTAFIIRISIDIFDFLKYPCS